MAVQTEKPGPLVELIYYVLNQNEFRLNLKILKK